MKSAFLLAAFFFALIQPGFAQPSTPPTPQQVALSAYFAQQVESLEGQLDREIKTKEDWEANESEYRRQLAEMLGLDPMPPRTELKATKTGEFEHEGIIVENLHYQSMPGLYVTANLYRPKVVEKPLPTILYVCGHSVKEKNGISYGNKAGYEHHGVWYAQHGFVCLVIDTVQLGEIRGEHHGTYDHGRYWWWARGYTPAGVEAWAGIRGLDYLETRPEVDKSRFGVTGRSGGGAYSWWVAALDERIKCAAPTAGITTLHNHVVDGCVAGHCDCMFMNNTYRWDYDKVAALVAPRALCIINTDKDNIFPLDGVVKIYNSTRRIYKLLGAEKNIGIQIAEGPHQDSQPLNTGEFHWMTRFLQGADPMSTLDAPAVHSIPMEKLRVFSELPKDERNTKIDESFVATAPEPKKPENAEEWAKQRDGWMKALKEKCFAGWGSEPSVFFSPKSVTIASRDGASLPKAASKVNLSVGENGTLERRSSNEIEATFAENQETEGVTLSRLCVNGDPEFDIYIAHKTGSKLADLDLAVLNVLDEQGWQEFANTYAHKFSALFPKDLKTQSDDKDFEQEKKMFQNFKWGMAYMCPRGIGPSAWDVKEKPTDPKAAAALEKDHVQRLRRFYLLGQTLEGQQVWDVRCAIRALRSVPGLEKTKLWLQASRTQAGNALYASLFEDGITRLDLHELPHSHTLGPVYLNVLKYLDMPQAVAMACERTRVVVYDDDPAAWAYPQQLTAQFDWAKDKKAGLQLRGVPKGE